VPRLYDLRMDLAAKLQLKADQKLLCVSRPDSLELGLDAARHASGKDRQSALLVFVADRASLDARRTTIADAALGERLTWVAYPKAGQLGTDLNRDRVAEHLSGCGIGPVRQIAIDEVWSALRFRASA
jgi:hypothetical protein